MKKSVKNPVNRQQSTRERRALLVDTAIACFLKQGIAQTGMRDIANAAGVSVGNLYNHFSGRDELIAEIARIETAGLEKVIAQVTDCTNPQTAIDTFVARYFHYCADYASAVLTIEITSESLRNPAVEALFSVNRSMLVEVLANALKNDNDDQPDATTIPARQTAGLIIDTIEGFALRVGLSGKKPRKSDLRALQVFIRSAVGPGIEFQS